MTSIKKTVDKDPYSAVWVSYSSLSDYLDCPRGYYLKNVYKDPVSGHKLSLMTPPLALGQAVHEVVESLSVLPVDDRFKEPLSKKFDNAWKKVAGQSGGFSSNSQEKEYKNRGYDMIKRVIDHPGPVAKLAVKITMDLPYYWLSDEDNIILCGKIDWLEYLPDSDGVHIIDFKTGEKREAVDSLQLPIYYLLAMNCQKRTVEKSSYWYLQHSNKLNEQPLPDEDKVTEQVLKLAKEISLARKLEKFTCKQGDGCRFCKPYEAVIGGDATFVGVNDFNQDVYVLVKNKTDGADTSVIL